MSVYWPHRIFCYVQLRIHRISFPPLSFSVFVLTVPGCLLHIHVIGWCCLYFRRQLFSHLPLCGSGYIAGVLSVRVGTDFILDVCCYWLVFCFFRCRGTRTLQFFVHEVFLQFVPFLVFPVESA